jgi:hypothetical protein
MEEEVATVEDIVLEDSTQLLKAFFCAELAQLHALLHLEELKILKLQCLSWMD